MTRILCYGDSNTWGYDPASGERFAADIRWTGVLRKVLASDRFEVIEEGLNGRTTVWDDPIEGQKNGRQYLIPCLESHRPLDLVVILLGTNDLKKRFSLSVPPWARTWRSGPLPRRLMLVGFLRFCGRGTLPLFRGRFRQCFRKGVDLALFCRYARNRRV